MTRDTASGTSGKIDFNALAINPAAKYAEDHTDTEEETNEVKIVSAYLWA